MPDLKFFDRSRRELAFESESECYSISQFQNWFVQVLSNQSIRPHFKVQEKLYSLEWDTGCKGFVLPRNDIVKKSLIGMSGKLILYDVDGSALSPGLYLTIDIITEEEFNEILDRLGQLAIAHESGVLSPVTVLRADGGITPGRNRTNGDAFEHLAKIVNKNWEIIKKNPAKEIRLGTKIIDLSNHQSSHTVRSVQHAAQNPHQRRQQILERQETYDSAENHFLVHILKNILIPKAKPLAQFYRSQASKTRRIQRQPTTYHGKAYLNLWRNRRVLIEAQVERLEKNAQLIEENIERVKKYLNEPFLQEARTNRSAFLRPSAKIANSKEYGPIYRAYQDFLNNKKPVQGRNLVWALEEKTIRRVSNLYEIWMFLEIYAKLADDFGFTADGNSPLDLAEVVDGEITLPAGSEYHLVFTSKDNEGAKPLCNIVISYAPKVRTPPCRVGKKCFSENVCRSSLPCYDKIENGDWYYLTPDITIIIQTGNLTKKIALDVKYRNYAQMSPYKYAEKRTEFKVDSDFELDLLGIAKMKYLNGLDYDAAFFLHSDPSPKYTTFGAEPFYAAPLREKGLHTTYYPAHRAGAICITPKNDENLDKLLRCFLMYHAGLESICWSCHTQLTEGNGGIKKQSGRQGDYYQCPECGEFWIGQVCGGPEHHRLIKMGKDSFHKFSAQNEWSCTCPACGDSFSEHVTVPE